MLQDSTSPIMCSYKLVNVSFDVWGLRDRVENYVHRVCTVLYYDVCNTFTCLNAILFVEVDQEKAS